MPPLPHRSTKGSAQSSVHVPTDSFATPRAQSSFTFRSRLSNCRGCTTCVAATVKDCKPPLTQANSAKERPSSPPRGCGGGTATGVVASKETFSTVSFTILLSQTSRCHVLASCVMAAKGPSDSRAAAVLLSGFLASCRMMV